MEEEKIVPTEPIEMAFGCLNDLTDVRDYTLSKIAVKAMHFPTAFECEKRAMVKSQRKVGSCTAHAASTILEYHYTGKNPILSTNFLYGLHYQLYNSTGPGLRLREACQMMYDYGDPEWTYCRGNTEVDEVYEIANEAFANPEAMANAEKYKIAGYVRLHSNDEVKYALMTYGPVLASIRWYTDNECDDNGVLYMGEDFESNHAIVIYGWDKTGWLCQNSWGVFWGKGGYFTLPYEYGYNETWGIIPTSYGDEIKKPIRNKLFDIIYKLINKIANLFHED